MLRRKWGNLVILPSRGVDSHSLRVVDVARRGGRVGERSRHWPALDGLRGVAILLVVAGHAGILPAAVGGYGVTLFFVLSGFLITNVLLHRDEGIGRFYASRAVRLLPALVVMLVVVGGVWLVQGRSFGWYAEQAAAALFYVENFFWTRHALEVLNHTWSLSVEEQFYLLWPLVLPLLMKGGARRRFLVMLVLIVGSVVLRLGVSKAGHWSLSYMSLPTNAYALLLGCLLAMVLWPQRWRRSSLVVGWTILGVAILGAPVFPHGAITGSVLVAGAGALLVHAATLGSAFLSSAPLRFLGRVSYAWYLWHWPLLWLSGITFEVRTALPMVAVALVAAVVSTYLVEEPLRRRWRTHTQAGSADELERFGG